MDTASLRQLIKEESAAMMEHWRKESAEMLHKCTQQFSDRLLEVDSRNEERFKRMAEEVQKLQQHKDASVSTPSTQISLSVNAELRGQPEPDAVDELLQDSVQAWMIRGREDHHDFVPSWAQGMQFKDLQLEAYNCQLSTKAMCSASWSGYSTNAGTLPGEAPESAEAAAEQEKQQLKATRRAECTVGASSPIDAAPDNGVSTVPQARSQGLSTKQLKEHMTRVNPRACLLCHGVFKHTR